MEDEHLSDFFDPSLDNAIIPTAKDLNSGFGPNTKFYSCVEKKFKRMWTRVQSLPEVSLKYDSWLQKMELVYGDKPDSNNFFAHTYLVTLIKFILHQKIVKEIDIDHLDYSKLINGIIFQENGIQNLIEDDYFNWICHPTIYNDTIEICQNIIRGLKCFNLKRIGVDLFKDIYEELVKMGTRHKSGEYYTPEWLSELIILRLYNRWVEDNPKKIPRLFDPACGSGTFLTNAIKLLKNICKGCFKDKDLLELIFTHIIGADINPIAVITSRANYLIALGDNLLQLGEKIFLPIFNTDSIKIPEKTQNRSGTDQLFFSFQKERRCDILMGNPPWIVLRTFKGVDYKNFLKSQLQEYGLSPNSMPKTLARKELSVDQWPLYYLSKIRRVLITQMEIATLFFVRTADLYLNDGGLIGFLLPISTIIGYNQHVLFRQFKNPIMRLLEIHNFSKVDPIFSLPTICVICKKGEPTTYPVEEVSYKLTLSSDERNCSLTAIQSILDTSKTFQNYMPPTLPVKFSAYYNESFVGASLFPQPFWYIAFDNADGLSFTKDLPRVKTSSRLLTKKNWKNIQLEGIIEAEYIFASLLGKDLLPFGIIAFRPILLPLIIKETTKTITPIEVSNIDSPYLHKWLEKAQQIWVKQRTKKSEKNFPTIIERLNYQKMLENMPLFSPYMVIWNARGADSFAHVLNMAELPDFETNAIHIRPRKFIPDITLYCISTENIHEAHYLCAILNSPLIHKAVKPFQPKGKYGYRDVGNRPLMINIPLFKQTDDDHTRLETLSLTCHQKVKSLVFNPADPFKRRRNQIKKVLKEDYDQINFLVSKITSVDLSVMKTETPEEDEEGKEEIEEGQEDENEEGLEDENEEGIEG